MGSRITASLFIAPGSLPEQLGSLHKAGSTKMKHSSTNPIIAGVDVGKYRLDVAVRGGAAVTLENQPQGHEQLIAFLRRQGVHTVGLEASGGYERAVAAALRRAGFTVAVLQPRQVRAYARLRLTRAKTDRLDAGLIAACTATLDPAGAIPDERLAVLAEALTFIEQIEEDLARAKTRREHVRDERLKALFAEEITRLRTRRRAELARLVDAVKREADLAARLALLESIPGLGERTALALVVRLPELGHLSREAVASLVGLAPFNDDSGRHAGERHIAGGRDRVRKSLYACAQAAALRWNKELMAFYARLRAEGKAHKVAMVACARKLVIYANAVLARAAPWQTQPA
jgi:transposase